MSYTYGMVMNLERRKLLEFTFLQKYPSDEPHLAIGVQDI